MSGGFAANIRLYRDGFALMFSRHPSLTITALASDRVCAIEAPGYPHLDLCDVTPNLRVRPFESSM